MYWFYKVNFKISKIQKNIDHDKDIKLLKSGFMLAHKTSFSVFLIFYDKL